MRTSRIFVDTSGWVALFSQDDQSHEAARRCWDRLRKQRRSFLTTDYVLDETYTLLRRGRGGLPMAIAFHDVVQRSRVLEMASIDEELRKNAWELFTSYSDKIFSFTDCTSFAVMGQRRLFEVFTFDRDFQRAGFVVCPREAE